MSNRHWILWDGSCGMCSATAQWIRRRDPNRQFQICQFQNCPRPPMTDEIFARCSGELIVITADKQVLGGARGMFFILERTGWGVFARILSWPPFIWLAAVGYRIIAANRGWISQKFFKTDACGLDNRYPEVDVKP